MRLDEVRREELQKMMDQLEQSLYHHIQWHNALIRTMICKLPPDQHDLAQDSYKDCRFGQWYYNAAGFFLEHPGFISLGEEHKQMHQLAISLLNDMDHITTYEYDKFANFLERMRLEVAALLREIENLLYNRDPLTGAVNRVNMLPILRELQARAKREGQSCCLIMMDFDKFKEINDLYGHLVGDKVLVESINYLFHQIRPCDKIFRYGGEEFLLFLSNISIKNALVFIERVLKGLAAMKIQITPNDAIHITASFGLTLLDLDLPIERSIDNADKALLAAKDHGKNCIKVWGEEFFEKTTDL